MKHSKQIVSMPSPGANAYGVYEPNHSAVKRSSARTALQQRDTVHQREAYMRLARTIGISWLGCRNSGTSKAS